MRRRIILSGFFAALVLSAFILVPRAVDAQCRPSLVRKLPLRRAIPVLACCPHKSRLIPFGECSCVVRASGSLTITYFPLRWYHPDSTLRPCISSGSDRTVSILA